MISTGFDNIDTTVIKVTAPSGSLRFKLQDRNKVVTISIIDDDCPIKDKIQKGDELIGIDDVYFRGHSYSYSFSQVIELVKSKRKNRGRTLIFIRRRLEGQKSKKGRGGLNKSWERRKDELVAFQKENGHTNVPRKYSTNKQLGKWVTNQRQQHKLLTDGKPSSLTQERINQLEALGFYWCLYQKRKTCKEAVEKKKKVAAREVERRKHKQKKEIAARKEIAAAARKAIEVELRKHEEDKKAIEFERRKREADKEEAREVERRKRVNQVILKTTKTNRLGAEQLVKTVTNMVQAIHTRTRPCTDHFVFDPNPQGSTANKLIRKLRHNNGNGQYGTCVFSIDEELKFTCAFAITTIGACGSVDTQLIPLSKMVVYCHTNGLYELVPFFESIDTQISFANAIVQLVPKLTAVVQQGTPTPDRNIMKPVLQAFFQGLGGKNNDYKPTQLPLGDTPDSRTKSVSARMVTASIYLPNGKMNIVCNQMYHNQISEQNRNICQRMNQSTTSREPGNITFFLDFPRQPYKVRKLAADMMTTGVGLTQSNESNEYETQRMFF